MTKFAQIKKSIDAWRLATQEPMETQGTRGVWVHGPPGTGKTQWAQKRSMEIYGQEPFINTGNNWMDGYSGQKVIVIEDLDKYTAHKYAHHLKLWADQYKTTAEVKGGTIPLMHEVLIVTSNYTIEEAFGADDQKHTDKQREKCEVTIEAIKDRFQQIEFKPQAHLKKRQKCE